MTKKELAGRHIYITDKDTFNLIEAFALSIGFKWYLSTGKSLCLKYIESKSGAWLIFWNDYDLVGFEEEEEVLGVQDPSEEIGIEAFYNDIPSLRPVAIPIDTPTRVDLKELTPEVSSLLNSLDNLISL